VTFRGLKILGFEGSRWYNGGINQYTDNQMKMRVFKMFPRIWWHSGVDIVISHAPPRYIGDAEDLCHRGFKSFHYLINHIQPRYFIHGHIHALFNNTAERIRIVKHTQVINAVGHYFLEIHEKQIF
jgi:Icc-related predicted phosphoesterase